MKRVVFGWLALVALMMTTACGGCDDPVGPGADAGDALTGDAGDAGSDAGEDVAPPVICEAGEIVRCRQENSPAIDRCNADGTAVEASSCPTSPLSVCREGACVEVECIPGSRRCADATQPQVCNDEGTGWSDAAACTGDSICETGNCLDRCQLAEVTNSYVGCEYWAVELDNALLNEEGSLPPDQAPPFAIVLANTSSTYDALVTVYSADGEVAVADRARVVGSDVGFPGQTPVTVESELVGPDGRVLREFEGEVERLPLPRGSIMTLVMPPRPIPYGESTVVEASYRIASTQPVVAYQFNPLCCNYNFTNDASLLLPTSALTSNYSFLSYEVWQPRSSSGSYGPTLTVVATEADTDVEVQLRPSARGNAFADILFPNTAPERITGPDPSGRYQVRLQPHEVLNLSAMAAGEDLTGARITSSKPVSVFGGHTCAFVPDGNAACDHLEQQLFPVETWGRSFVNVPLKFRGMLSGGAATLEGTYWKFLALQDDTTVQTGIDIDHRNGPDVHRQTSGAVRPCLEFSDDPTTGEFTLDAGESCVFGTRIPFVARSGKPLMVGGFLSGQGSVESDAQWGDHAGDPAFFLVPPEEQFRTDYSFLTPETYFVSYVTVVIRKGFPVTLDGELVDLTLHDYEEIPGEPYARAHIMVDPGPHRISADVPFGIVVYGYDDYVSYAFTGGLDLAKLNTVP